MRPCALVSQQREGCFSNSVPSINERRRETGIAKASPLSRSIANATATTRPWSSKTGPPELPCSMWFDSSNSFRLPQTARRPPTQRSVPYRLAGVLPLETEQCHAIPWHRIFRNDGAALPRVSLDTAATGDRGPIPAKRRRHHRRALCPSLARERVRVLTCISSVNRAVLSEVVVGRAAAHLSCLEPGAPLHGCLV